MLNNPFRIFTHPVFGDVRTALYDDKLVVVGKDACHALGYVRPDRPLARYVDDKDKFYAFVPILRRTSESVGAKVPTPLRRTVVITESGLYSLVFAANTPEAREFKHWVTSEVLPALRTNGSYTLFDSTEAVQPVSVAQPAPVAQPVEQPAEQTIVKTINAVDLADLVVRMDALEEKVANMEFAFKELAAALNRNADAQLSKRERADKLIALADRLTDSPERNQLYLQAANLINGKRLF